MEVLVFALMHLFALACVIVIVKLILEDLLNCSTSFVAFSYFLIAQAFVVHFIVVLGMTMGNMFEESRSQASQACLVGDRAIIEKTGEVICVHEGQLFKPSTTIPLNEGTEI